MRSTKRSVKQKLILSGAIVVLLAGGAAAVLAGRGNGHQSLGASASAGAVAGAVPSTSVVPGATEVASPGATSGASRGGAALQSVAASYLGVTAAQIQADQRSGQSLAQVANATSGKSVTGLIDALVAARKERLAAAVAAKKLSQAKESKLAATLVRRMTTAVDRVRVPGRSLLGLSRGSLSTAASYLGLTVAQVQTELRSGRSLAQITNATSGKSAATLITALVAARKEKLAAAVAAGRIKQAQESRIAAKLPARVTAEVNRVPVAGG